jgi:sigma-54 dependent transcriptional regulator, acetoin dehydrogenase operon transcriptional activator AcoR
MQASENLIAEARLALERRDIVPAGLLSSDIYESWNRCVLSGLDPRTPPSDQVESTARLREARDRHGLARRLATAEMNALHHQIAGTNFIIAFAAPDGMILDVISDRSTGGSARPSAIQPGSLWSEARCGTNALGTATILRRQVTVHGGEHFFAQFGGLMCIASPVFAPDGSLAGVIDASSDCSSRQQHTQALVAMAATQIENGLFREHHRDDLLIAFHSRGEYLHTLSTGLMAVDPDGRILAANAQARALLQGLKIARGQSFEELFRTRFDDLFSIGRKRERQVLEDMIGSAFVATIENFRAANISQRAESTSRPVQSSFVAIDPAVAKIVRQVEAAAARHVPVLIRGETGTGKEQLARHAHAASGRKGTFVPVNCAALPASLVEAELFGYAGGAFTGARPGGAIGLIKEADGGTLFLDEIGDMPIALQAVLLRFLDDWTVRPIGGSRTKVDVLLVSATNAGLDEAVAQGRFRPDLLYRLNTLEVTLPQLAARNDFDQIVRHLLAAIDPDCEITSGTIAKLAELPWPGNVRQLRNMLARFSLDASDGIIDEAALEALTGAAATPKIDGTLRECQRARILAAYAQSSNNISETSRRLNISRNTVYRALNAKARR